MVEGIKKDSAIELPSITQAFIIGAEELKLIFTESVSLPVLSREVDHVRRNILPYDLIATQSIKNAGPTTTTA